MEIEWQEAKRLIDLGASQRYVIDSKNNYIIIVNGDDEKYTCIMPNDNPASANQLDFETNYKSEKVFRDIDKDGNKLITIAPFASKKISGGSLFKRVHGVQNTISANSTGNIDMLVTYDVCKFNGAEIINCQLGDEVDFQVLDTPTGAISTIPNFMLNQFGFSVKMPDKYYKNTSEYDADLIKDMVVRCKYTNNSNSDIVVYLNVEMHEVRP